MSGGCFIHKHASDRKFITINRVLADKQDSTGEVNHESLVYQ
ncbi:hypothetical protein Pvag_3455 [Pantoea vagans C9-1]|nr:hypothetical protein Pvag_3455 [Pantoea vagans C9-1]